jgi:carboxypeptidase Taq
MMKSYNQIERRFKRLTDLNGALAVLHWDSAAMMPAGGATARADQITALSLVCHDMMVDPSLNDLLSKAELESDKSPEDFDNWHLANLAEMRRMWQHANAVPSDLVEALSQATSACEMVWRDARPDNDFARLEPLLTHLVSLVKEVAVAKSEALGISPYDALLDEFDPGTRSADIDPLFDGLDVFLPEFLQQVKDVQSNGHQPEPLNGKFAVADQRALAERLMNQLGFDFDFGRLDVSHHPFTGGVPDDVRITTRYYEDDFTQSLMGVLHETGHALYERGLPSQWRHQPVGAARGMTMHESQSLIIEMLACRSEEFVRYLTPLVKETFGGSGPAWEAENLVRHYRRVQPGLIRVDADEVTYPAHVILRYRLEKSLISGDLTVADLPGAWNEAMQNSLGLTPPDDRDGVLQDIHWPSGAFGYFPTYTLGAMAAAQLFDAAQKDNDAVVIGLEHGDFGPLLSWLRTHVHALGSLMSTQDLMIRATKKPLDVEVYKAHLTKRYLGE